MDCFYPKCPCRRLDVEKIRTDFPILSEQVRRGKALIYFDNAATTQKPKVVIDRMHHYYLHENANIHRGIHYLSERATVAYESSRTILANFLNAAHASELIYTRGTTEGINLVAHSFVAPRVGSGDEILITAMEHHSNIVPWQIVCQKTGAALKVIPMTDAGELEMDQAKEMLNGRTKFLGVVHVSNALGTINPVAELIELAHAKDIPVLVDGAQAVAHMPVDVQALDCDFYAISGHKMYGPTGIGMLYGKGKWLDEMEPYQGGGDMISEVTFEKTTYNEVPHKFEAGTPHIAGALGLATAAEYLQRVGLNNVGAYEHDLLAYATERMELIDGVRIIGTAARKAGLISFELENAHPHDIAHELDRAGIAIRAGHHCAQPVMQRLGVNATARASFAMYNTPAEIDLLIELLPKINEKFAI